MLTDVLGTMGFGHQVLVSVTLILVALYVWRAAAIARLVGALVGTAVGYVIMLCVAAAVAIAGGWIDFHPDIITAHAARAASYVVEHAEGVLRVLLDVPRRLAEVIRGR